MFAPSFVGAVTVPVNSALPLTSLNALRTDCAPRVEVASGEVEVLTVNALSTLTTRTRPSDSELAMIMYTSGSAGRPRGVMCPIGPILFAADAIQRRLQYTETDRVFVSIPLTFDYGLYQVFLSLLSGAHVLLVGAPGPQTLRSIRTSEATIVPVVPTLARILTRLALRDRQAGNSVRMFTNTGEHLAPSVADGLRRGFPGAGIRAMYGLTECKRVSIADMDEDIEAPGSVGRPLDGTQVTITTSDGAEVDRGDLGEIVVEGPHVMAGYWHGNAGEGCRFEQDGSSRLLRTGDFGQMDALGRLSVTGRRDSIFKLNGTRVSTIEIEAAASAIPGVEAVVVYPPTSSHPTTLFYVGLNSPAAVRRQLADSLEPAKIPQDIERVDRIPTTVNGKLDRVGFDKARAIQGCSDAE